MEPRTGIAARKAAIDLIDAVLTRKASLDNALATTPGLPVGQLTKGQLTKGQLTKGDGGC